MSYLYDIQFGVYEYYGLFSGLGIKTADNAMPNRLRMADDDGYQVVDFLKSGVSFR